jgi:hypothetical protein
VSFLLDTNVISEIRKGPRADPGVRAWFESASEEELHLSALVLGELRRGVERMRTKDPVSAEALHDWLTDVVSVHAARILPVTHEVAECWGRMGIEQPLPVIDALLGATARVHGLTVVTRNEKDLTRTGAVVLNPFR